VISVENSIQDDYVSEKFFHPFASGSVPLYWGAPNVAQYNPGKESFLHVRDYMTDGKPDVKALAGELFLQSGFILFECLFVSPFLSLVLFLFLFLLTFLFLFQFLCLTLSLLIPLLLFLSVGYLDAIFTADPLRNHNSFK